MQNYFRLMFSCLSQSLQFNSNPGQAEITVKQSFRTIIPGSNIYATSRRPDN